MAFRNALKNPLTEPIAPPMASPLAAPVEPPIAAQYVSEIAHINEAIAKELEITVEYKGKMEDKLKYEGITIFSLQ